MYAGISQSMLWYVKDNQPFRKQITIKNLKAYICPWEGIYHFYYDALGYLKKDTLQLKKKHHNKVSVNLRCFRQSMRRLKGKSFIVARQPRTNISDVHTPIFTVSSLLQLTILPNDFRRLPRQHSTTDGEPEYHSAATWNFSVPGRPDRSSDSESRS